MTDRYQVTGLEGHFEPGSDDQVLANKQGITDPNEMDDLELALLHDLYELVLGNEFPNRSLRVADLKTWHRRWLGNVYRWAGQERTVNLSKGGLPFAASTQIPTLLEQFERECLNRFTPCYGSSSDALVNAIATTHVEFILIHPFREGNGRLGRLLADVMAAQAGYGLLDYSHWKANRPGYFAAIQYGLRGDYGPMRTLVEEALSL